MISIYSRIALILTIVTGLLCFIYYHFNLELPYFNSALNIIVISLLVLFFLRTNIRWQAVFKASKINGFKVSRAGWYKSVFQELIQWIFYLMISWFILNYLIQGYLIAYVLMLFIFESFLHIIIGIKHYKIVILENSITMINNNVLIISLNETKRIVNRHNDLQFKLKNNTIKIFDLDYLNSIDREDFENQIKEIAFKKEIFIDS